MYTHGGGFPGFATHVSFLPSQRLGVAVMANEGNLGGPLVELVAAAIYQRLAGGTIPGFNSFEEIESRIAQAPVEVFDAEKNQLRFALTGSGAVAPVEVVDGQVVAFTYQGRRFSRK